ncbi:MAG: hypothetical protein O3B84_05215 [Chloroflexi bacterium]|nr:hypothetical protein [Chloroflexota bacterium]
MRLTLAIHPISDAAFGGSTRIVGTRLEIDVADLERHLLDDRRIVGVRADLAHPGDSFRAGFIYDIVEPRAKADGDGTDFPGTLGPHAVAGAGTTHVLRGMAVTILDEGTSAGGKVLEMSGEAAEATPYGQLIHLVITPRVGPNETRASAMSALKLAGLKTAVYLARAATDVTPAALEVYDLEGTGGGESESRPRIAFIGQIHGHQHMIERGDHILYGSDLRGTPPVVLHPNEWLDGAVVLSYWNNHPEETYFHQNHPVIMDLYRRHDRGEIVFAGVIAMAAASEESDRERNCMMAANMAKWALRADAVTLTKYGGGAPHADMGQTAWLCERLGMHTAAMVSDASGDRTTESAALFNYPEVDAIIYVGGSGTEFTVSAERVVGGNAEAASALGGLTTIAARTVAGVANQQGAGRIRSIAY